MGRGALGVNTLLLSCFKGPHHLKKVMQKSRKAGELLNITLQKERLEEEEKEQCYR